MVAPTEVYYNLLKSQNFLMSEGKGLPMHAMKVYQLQTFSFQTFQLFFFFFDTATRTVSIHMH
jgi:hypothetical protein